LFTPDIFGILENLKPGKNGEIWIADAIDELIKKRDVYACELKDAKYYDCGSKVSFLPIFRSKTAAGFPNVRFGIVEIPLL
jgi:UTP--glucose-1-phosphate uridylyltransferase